MIIVCSKLMRGPLILLTSAKHRVSAPESVVKEGHCFRENAYRLQN